MDFSKLEALEERINDLLNKTAFLVQQNELLEKNLQVDRSEHVSTQARLNEAEAKIVTMQSENEAVVGKIDSLLQRLEQI